MIQRKQTLFLLAVAIIAILMFFMPFIKIVEGLQETTLSLVSFDLLNNQVFFPLILNVLVLILSVITIFLYKNRVFQYKLASGLILLNVFITGLFFLLTYTDTPGVHFTFGAFLPIIGGAFAFLAGHFIKKDEQLVRSADRIR